MITLDRGGDPVFPFFSQYSSENHNEPPPKMYQYCHFQWVNIINFQFVASIEIANIAGLYSY